MSSDTSTSTSINYLINMYNKFQEVINVINVKIYNLFQLNYYKNKFTLKMLMLMLILILTKIYLYLYINIQILINTYPITNQLKFLDPNIMNTSILNLNINIYKKEANTLINQPKKSTNNLLRLKLQNSVIRNNPVSGLISTNFQGLLINRFIKNNLSNSYKYSNLRNLSRSFSKNSSVIVQNNSPLILNNVQNVTNVNNVQNVNNVNNENNENNGLQLQQSNKNSANVIDNINTKYESYKKLLNEKSLMLKKKLESRKYILTNLDLRIFKVLFEDNKHIVLRHEDVNNAYKVEVSILKLNPKVRGPYLNYMLTFIELNLNADNLIEEDIKYKVNWSKKIESGFIGIGSHPLELFLDNYHSDLLNLNFTNRLLLIEDDCIKNNKLNIDIDIDISKITNDLIRTITINKDGIFIINKKLVDINKNLLIKIQNNSFNDNIDNCISLTINYNEENNNLDNKVYLIKIIKNKLKLNSIIDLDKKGKILTVHNILKFKKLKIKSKAKLEINNYNKNNNNNNKQSIHIKIKEINNITKFFEDNILNKFPLVFFYKHIYQDFDNYIEINNNHIKNKLAVFLRSKNKDLISTFAYLLTKNKTGKNIFNVLHFDHVSGYIVNNLNIKRSLNNADRITDRKKFINTKLDENFILCNFISNELNLVKEKYNNNNINQSKKLIQVSLNILGFLKLNKFNKFKGVNVSVSVSNSRRKKLFKLLDKIEASINIKFEIIDLAKYRQQECLQLFYIIYNNNPNTNIEIIIKNYNSLIEKRIKTIKNEYI